MAKVKQDPEVESSSFDHDIWLRESFKMEDDEERKPEVSKLPRQIKLEGHALRTSRKRNILDNQDAGFQLNEEKNEKFDALNKNRDTKGSDKLSLTERGDASNDVLVDDHLRSKKPRVVTDSVSWEIQLEQAIKSREVENLCKFKCLKCMKKYRSTPTLSMHFSKTGHGKNNEAEIKKCIIKMVSHKCKVCSKSVMCDKKVIQTHVKMHNIKTINKYLKMMEKKIPPRNKYSNNKKVQMEKNRNKIEEADVSKEVGNLCRYQCPTCKHIYESSGGFRKHVLHTWHIDLSKEPSSSFLIKVVAHRCKICSKKVLCDKITLNSHMSNHAIKSLKKYIETTNASRVEEKENTIVLLHKFCKKNSMKYEVTGVVGSLCRYKCDKCDYWSQTWFSMRKHCLALEHGPLSAPTQYLTQVVMHKCNVCEELLLADKLFIDVHLRKHKLTIRKYMEKTSTINSEETWHRQYHKELRKAIRDIPAIPAKTQLTLKANSLPASKVTKHIGDISFFKCPHCCRSGISYNCLLSHCRTKHNISFVAYDPKLLEEARYHQCHICSEIILCDTTIVRKHLGQNHGGMNLSEYKMEHVSKQGYIAIPNFKVYMTNFNVFNEVKISNPVVSAKQI